MGLDWLAMIEMTAEGRENFLRRFQEIVRADGGDTTELVPQNVPRYDKPCMTVGTPRMSDLPDFEERMQQVLEQRQADAHREQGRINHRNDHFIEHWLGMTLERLMAKEGPKFSCNECPLLKTLNGADSSASCFLGITVSSCDFRGKRIGADNALGDLAHEANADHDPDAMLDYADRLQWRLVSLRRQGLLRKDSYEDYVREHEADPFARAMGEPTLTREAYVKEPHWRERNIREAVHWLRTCAQHGIHLIADY